MNHQYLLASIDINNPESLKNKKKVRNSLSLRRPTKSVQKFAEDNESPSDRNLKNSKNNSFMKKIHYINKKQKIFHINSSDSSYSSSPQTHSASMNFENDIKISKVLYTLNEKDEGYNLLQKKHKTTTNKKSKEKQIDFVSHNLFKKSIPRSKITLELVPSELLSERNSILEKKEKINDNSNKANQTRIISNTPTKRTKSNIFATINLQNYESKNNNINQKQKTVENKIEKKEINERNKTNIYVKNSLDFSKNANKVNSKITNRLSTYTPSQEKTKKIQLIKYQDPNNALKTQKTIKNNIVKRLETELDYHEIKKIEKNKSLFRSFNSFFTQNTIKKDSIDFSKKIDKDLTCLNAKKNEILKTESFLYQNSTKTHSSTSNNLQMKNTETLNSNLNNTTILSLSLLTNDMSKCSEIDMKKPENQIDLEKNEKKKNYFHNLTQLPILQKIIDKKEVEFIDIPDEHSFLNIKRENSYRLS